MLPPPDRVASSGYVQLRCALSQASIIESQNLVLSPKSSLQPVICRSPTFIRYNPHSSADPPVLAASEVSLPVLAANTSTVNTHWSSRKAKCL